MADAPRSSALRSTLLIVVAVLMVVGLTVEGVRLFSRKQAAGGPSGGAASGRPTVAVLAFGNHTGEPARNWYGTSAAELLAADLSRLLNVEVTNVPALDARAAAEAARKSGATLLVRGETTLDSGSAGSAGVPPASVTLKAEVVEAATGKVLDAGQVAGVDDKNMLAKVDELAGLIAEKLKPLTVR